MENITLTKRLKDNQSYDKAYSFVDDVVDCEEKEISEQFWDGIIRDVHDINRLLNQHKIITIPHRNSYKNNEIFTRINDKLYTYNWVGVISNRSEDGNNYRIEITSRFDTGEKQFFLLYLLCSVCGINVFDISVNSEMESDYIPVLVILFLQKLVEAYGDGLYKEYVRKEYNDYNFKGAMDINRHIKINNLFVGKTAYSTREYSYDNEILCLIRQTIDYIVDYYPAIWKGYISNNSIVNEVVEIIETATPSYRVNINYAELLKCRKEITNPMYKNYDDARKLALMILYELGQNIFDNADEDSFGILIDISWLWEEFVAIKLLEGKRYCHLLTDGSKGSLQWADREYWYPDFLEIDDENRRRNVFDAKYKFWKWNKDSDVHQLLSYLFLTGGESCGIIYPADNNEEIIEYKVLNAFDSFYGEASRMYKLPLFIPQNKNIGYIKYCEEIEEAISNWKRCFNVIK